MPVKSKLLKSAKSILVLVPLTLMGCELPTTVSTERNVKIVNAEVKAEVCASVSYIFYDTDKDSAETITQARAHNEVLQTVYDCKVPE